jgi:nucleotide-binding universal stress UspA family protein
MAGITMSTAPSEPDRPFTLVVGVDLADTASSGFAFEEAARIARRIPGSQMHVVHVMRDKHEQRGAAREDVGLLRMYVEEKARAMGGMESQSFGVHVRAGDPAAQIAQLAVDLGADLVVVGAHAAPRLRNLVVGSTAARVMGHAPCPVFIAGPRPKPEPPHVIVIEGPCPDCLATRTATSGKQWWCARHSESHHLHHHHVYSYHGEIPFGDHDSEVTATGVD